MPAHDRLIHDLTTALAWALSVVPEPMHDHNMYARRHAFASETLAAAKKSIPDLDRCPSCHVLHCPTRFPGSEFLGDLLCHACAQDRQAQADRSDRGLHENPEL